MNLENITNEVNNLEKTCVKFLSARNLSEEDLEKINMKPTVLEIKAFNSIVSDCKEEVKNAPIERMASVLKLLFDIETESFDVQDIGMCLENFVNQKLNSGLFAVNEKHLNSMKKTLDNIDDIKKHLVYMKNGHLKSGTKRQNLSRSNANKLIELILKLEALSADIRLQIEYDAKKIVNDIIDDFYNVYIFFSFIVYMTIAQEEELLSIEIANELDRFTKMINYALSNRTLKNQDMLYYYATHELNELKKIIYSHISQYDTYL